MAGSKNSEQQRLGLAGLAFVAISAAVATSAIADVRYTVPIRTVTAGSTASDQTQSQTSTDLLPFDVSVRQNASALIGGNTLESEAIAAISCTFDPEGVRARTILESEGEAAQQGSIAGTAESVIDTIVTTDTPIPYRIRGEPNQFSGGTSSMLVSLTNVQTGEVLVQSTQGHTGSSRFERTGILMPGSYRFLYSVELVGVSSSERDFDMRFDAGCPADLTGPAGPDRADGAVTIDDLLRFLVLFEEGDEDADMDDGDGLGQGDGAVTVDDLLFYLRRFEEGC